MKVRTGLVSNSSSSSYLVIGFPREDKMKLEDLYKTIFEEEFVHHPEKWEDPKDELENFLFRGKNRLSMIRVESVNKDLIGFTFTTDEYELEEISMEDISKMTLKLLEVKHELGLSKEKTSGISIFSFTERS